MSATETQTATATPPQEQPAVQSPPEITVLTRVASIPMIHSSLETINDKLSTNTYTRSTYTAAKELSTAAYKLSEPLQIKLAPLIISADGYANKAVDAVESRYPYPFKAKPEEVVEYVRERKQSASEYVHIRIDGANKTLDEKIKSPALNVAHDLDQRLSPLVDYFEKTVTSLTHSEPGPSSPDAQYQYQRALALSRTLKDSVYEYSAEQLKHIQAQSIIVQRATESAQSINSLASSSFANAQTRVQALSESMLSELQKLQSQTASLAASIQTTINTSKSQIQNNLAPQIQQTYSEISSALGDAISDLTEILKKKDTPLPEKVGLVGKEVRERVTPLLETVRKGFSDILARGKDVVQTTSGPAEAVSEETPSSEEKATPANGSVEPPLNGETGKADST
ncbi:hypothetical protein CC1G_00305 [Coprinopsis cinerea okayama7|uniref:Lipid droplet-associated perilipin protein n=1 Tax=Coprinopsis cinerea (strain Okayama-7 / 130 / ATCC MYA-4618 / FGSC 9003) TaxID=240176 RepID=A8NXH4_COPC7|nr:hypothetical protein CC1G_00305 [Coprinopsis cinerea okayama7\|eukprot:XP_001837169.1 hypothetical protein CC1G_00305 [Coprinopsis cinerea okayama7\